MASSPTATFYSAEQRERRGGVKSKEMRRKDGQCSVKQKAEMMNKRLRETNVTHAEFDKETTLYLICG